PVTILRRHGVEPEVLTSRLTARMRDMELREERLKKRFELPPFLKHFATNLNLLARQDKLPPVYGRDQEIQQVLEILCHRDRAKACESTLARGGIRLVAATALSEYKEYIQAAEALARRSRSVTVCEPTIEETRRILYNLRPRLERNYSVHLLDEAIETALEMSPRYMRHLHLPDKVIGWLDTAAVRAEIDRRWEVKKQDVVSVISHAAQIPEDMVF